MLSKENIHRILPDFDDDLLEELLEASEIKQLPPNSRLIREGQCIKTIPIVLSGLVRVFIGHEDKELLLYHVKPAESCIMLLSAGLNNEKSRVFVDSEEDTTVLMIPVDKLSKWIKESTALNALFFNQYALRYNGMFDMIRSILCDNIDERLHKYLKYKVSATGNNPLKLSHRQIAAEIGTAREVISRAMKRLEKEGKISQISCTVKVL